MINLGKHVLVNGRTESPEILQDPSFIQSLMTESTFKDHGITALNFIWHDFGDGFGFTGIVLLAESHWSIHTWPEYCAFTMDLYTCGATNPAIMAIKILEEIGCKEYDLKIIERGF